MTRHCKGTARWQLVFALVLEGLVNVQSKNISYATVGDNITIICPINEVFSWTFLKTKEILAFCNGKNSINMDSRIAQRLHVSSNCRLTIYRFLKEDVGEYKCSHPTKIYNGKKSHIINIQLRTSSVVQNETVFFKAHDQPRTLECNVFAAQDNYTYKEWLHYTYSNQLIRILDGEINGTLILPNNDTENLRYEDSGLYICNVTNNIQGENGHLWQTGKIKVIVEGRPVLAKLQKQIYIGYLNVTSIINIYILSSSKVSIATWFDANGNELEIENCSTSETETEFHGKLVNVSAYKCAFLIRNVQEKDFQKYAVEVHNSFGKSVFYCFLIPARKPEMPKNLEVIALKIEIIVKWQIGDSGKFLQTFFIEYRKRFDREWNILPADSKTSLVIDGLHMNTIYFVRMFSRSILGESNKTDEVIVKTGNHHLVIHSYSWKIGAFTSVVVIVFILCMYGIKAMAKRLCLNIAPTRSNTLQGNETSPSYVNGIIEHALDNTPLATQQSPDNGINSDNNVTSDDGTENHYHEIIPCGNDPNTSSAVTDNIFANSSSDDSYLVHCRKYINVEIAVTDEHNEQESKQEYSADSSSDSDSESNQTHIKSDHKYETLATTNFVEHSYEIPFEIY